MPDETDKADTYQDWIHVFRIMAFVALRRLVNQYEIERINFEEDYEYLLAKGMMKLLEETSDGENTTQTLQEFTEKAEEHFEAALDNMFEIDEKRRPVDEKARKDFDPSPRRRRHEKEPDPRASPGCSL